jgi:hypothetical protein
MIMELGLGLGDQVEAVVRKILEAAALMDPRERRLRGRLCG